MTRSMSVGYQGSTGAYSQQAAVELYNNENIVIETVPFSSFDLVFDAVENGSLRSGIVPLENTESGVFLPVRNLLLQKNVFITGEHMYHETHCLAALPGTELKDVTRLLAHPHVILQCGKFLDRLSKEKISIEILLQNDTAEPASLIKHYHLTKSATIVSESCAKYYGLEVLSYEIEDNPNSLTRFLRIENHPVPTERHRNPKTSIIFTLKNIPGALSKALSAFALRDLNVSKIESWPSRRVITSPRFWELVFLVDIEAGLQETRLMKALDTLQEFSVNLKNLGSYPQSMDIIFKQDSDFITGIGM